MAIPRRALVSTVADLRDTEDRPLNRFAVLVFGGGAVLLAPWIVVLYLSQRQVAGGYHLRLTSLGMSVFTVVGLLMAAAAFRKRAPSAVVWIGSAATYLFISAWFDTITANHRPVAVAFIYEFWVKVPLIAYSIWFALKATRDRGTRSVPRWFPISCVVGVVVLIPLFIIVASVAPRTAQLHNLRLFWTGLDIFEFIGLALTGWCLYRRSRYVVVTATITGTLLFSDAWFNFVTTVGKQHRAAFVMALVEVPVSFYSFVIARREISSWIVTPADDSGEGDEGDGDRPPAHRLLGDFSSTEKEVIGSVIGSAMLTLTREGVGIELRRGRFEIWVDDKSAGALEPHETVDIPVEPAHHTLRIRAGRYSSQDRSFDVADGEVVSFRVHGAMIWPRYVASIVKPDLAISLTGPTLAAPTG
ncbi:MAG TPA: hypothetical protein VG014_10450 [Acidimicrobiales bacterium]|nr:hypothetical protein [Acidimicrobiales bacterium]